ncbi:hypothetical protein BDV98DRAFT_299435 [Pterulicium gracile]|uniref:Uncharacterized protein n=1 Tax=Pterulicium gracile TaxID=1884261 RepID=A0A5C3QEP8_9AGAR|nr:hypothetical protein BDV98DRAFT_299435 [Pterula gracilis]
MLEGTRSDATSRLPPELLERIFQSSVLVHMELSDEITQLSAQTGHTPESTTAWNLSHVCVRWRKIAARSLRLWSKITLDFPEPRRDEVDDDKRTNAHAEEILHLQLQRSKGTLLQVRVLNLSRRHRLFDILLEEADRWEVALVDICAAPAYLPTTGDIIRQLKLGVSGGLPQLQTLAATLSCFEEEAQEPRRDDLHCSLESLPKLTRASLKGPLVDIMTLPWCQLTALELTDYRNNGQVESILPQCPRLERLSLSLIEDYLDVLRLPKLEELNAPDSSFFIFDLAPIVLSTHGNLTIPWRHSSL